MKNITTKLIVISIITIFFFEIFGFILSSLKFIPNGSPAVISLFANKTWSFWHPKKISFKHHYNECWEPAKIYFNNIGARGKKDVKIEKVKDRIAIVGDSMIEMIHVNEGEDLRSLIEKELPEFEVINFGARGMGLYDQLDIYKNLIREYKVDYLILYITENDFENNFISSSKPDEVFNQPKFYVEKGTNKIIKIDRNNKKFDNYYSNINKLKRSKLILYLKEYSYTFKTYFQLKVLIRNKKILNSNNKLNKEKYLKEMDLLIQKEKVYEHLINLFINEISKDNLKLIPIFNLRSYLFKDPSEMNFKEKIKDESFKIMRKLWIKYDPHFYLDEAKKYIKNNEKLIKKPYLSLGHTCDDHYSKFGSEFMAKITTNIIKNYTDK